MTAYISRTGGQKKKNILRQKELELIGEIRRDSSETKIISRAEKVRKAQLGVIKALMKELQPLNETDAEKNRTTLKKLNDKKEFWEKVSLKEIQLMYSEDLDKYIYVDWKKW